MIKRLLRKYIWVAVILVYRKYKILNKYLTNQNKYCIINHHGKDMQEITHIIQAVALVISVLALVRALILLLQIHPIKSCKN